MRVFGCANCWKKIGVVFMIGVFWTAAVWILTRNSARATLEAPHSDYHLLGSANGGNSLIVRMGTKVRERAKGFWFWAAESVPVTTDIKSDRVAIREFGGGDGRQVKFPDCIRVELVEVSTDGSLCAITASEKGGGGQYYLYIVDLQSGDIVRRIQSEAGGFGFAVFSPDGKRIVAPDKGEKVEVKDARSGAVLFALEEQFYAPFGPVAFSPDGAKWAVISLEPEEIQIWDGTTGKKTKAFPVKGNILSLAFSPDGKILAIGHASGTVRLRDVVADRDVREFRAHEGRVFELKFLAGGAKLLSACEDGDDNNSKRTFVNSDIRIWDLVSGEEVRRIPMKENAGRSFAVSPNERVLAKVRKVPGTRFHHEAQAVELWDLETGEQTAIFPGCSQPIFPGKDDALLMQRDDGAILLWDLPPRKAYGRIAAYAAGLTVVTVLFGYFLSAAANWLWKRRDAAVTQA